jgi:hypothetical protein
MKVLIVFFLYSKWDKDLKVKISTIYLEPCRLIYIYKTIKWSWFIILIIINREWNVELSYGLCLVGRPTRKGFISKHITYTHTKCEQVILIKKQTFDKLPDGYLIRPPTGLELLAPPISIHVYTLYKTVKLC